MIDYDKVADFVADLFGTLGVAGLLGFVAFAYSKEGFGVAWTAFAVFAVAYFVGRWHAGKAWKRDLYLLNEHYRGKDRE